MMNSLDALIASALIVTLHMVSAVYIGTVLGHPAPTWTVPLAARAFCLWAVLVIVLAAAFVLP
jgi:hypothetical protein